MATIYRVLSTPVWVRSEPSVNGEILGVIYKDEIVEAETQIGIWIKHERGYSCLKDSTGKDLFEKLETPTTFRMMRASVRSGITVGMAVRINQSAVDYTNAGAGIRIPQWVKDRTHIVSQVREFSGEMRVLLGHPDGINSWVRMSDVTSADTSSTPVTDLEAVDYEDDYIPDISGTLDDFINKDTKVNLDTLSIKTLRGVHGIPYQFMPICDTRLQEGQEAFGRKYAEKIIARMPLLMITPGHPVFLKGFSKDTKKNMIQTLINKGINRDEDTQSQLDEILSRETRFYSLEFDWIEYFEYVNPLCRAGAFYLGIEDFELDGEKLRTYDWYKNTNPDLVKHLHYKGAIPFYIHSDNQVSESFDNGTTTSMLSSTANKLSDTGREINFIIGASDSKIGTNVDKFLEDLDVAGNLENMSDLLDGIIGGGNIFSNIAKNIKVVASGGRLIFPEIWSESRFSRDYSIKIKLTSPDNDVISWYLNIFVPLMHLICLAAPRQTSANGLISPFLVRAFYKGLFNIDTGIITDMRISKGEEGAWTKEGLPTVVDVDFTIKDLYDVLTITRSSDYKYDTLNNVALMDYIATTCGININEVDISRILSMYFTMNISARVKDTIRLNIFGEFDQWATNTMYNIYRKLQGK